MKKTIILFLLFFTVGFLFAGGSTEVVKNETLTSSQVSKYKNLKWLYINRNTGAQYTVDAKSGENQPSDSVGYVYEKDGQDKIVYTSEEQGLLAGWLETLSNTLNSICFRFILAIHPFPNILFKMYNTESFANTSAASSVLSFTMASDSARTGIYSSDYLLIDNNFYDTSVLNNNKYQSSSKWKVSIAEKAGVSGTSSQQYRKWSVVTLLFVTMFAAEMLFMSIWGYVTGTTENVLKEIAKKAGITFALFILVSALPFLLESMRYGFFQIAGVFYGSVAESYSTGAQYSRYFENPGEIFNLPGSFAEQMIPFFSSTTVAGGTEALKTQLGSIQDKYNVFLKLLIVLIMFIFRFVMFFAILKASLHIAVNTIEVYLLLSLTMILVPFSVFEPVKPIGAKCIMSLVTNLIECFVILVIVICVVPAAVTVCQEMLEDITGYQNKNLLISERQITATANKTTETIGYIQIVAHPDFTMLVLPLANYNGDDKVMQIGFYIGKEKLTTGNVIGELKKHCEAYKIDYVFDVKDTGDKSLKDLGNPAYILNQPGVYQYQYKYLSGGSKDLELLKSAYISQVGVLISGGSTFSTDLESRTRFIEGLISFFNSSTVLSGYIDYVKNLYAESYIGSGHLYYWINETTSTFPSASSPSGTVSKSSTSSINWIGQLLLCFMGMYIPVFFVQQSTAITNSLLNGSAALESFANAMSNMARTTMNIGRSVLAVPVKVTGAMSKMYNDAQMQQVKKGMENQKNSDPSGAEKLNT